VPHLSLYLALALVAGLAGGVLVDRPLALAESIALSGSWTFAVLAYRTAWPRVFTASLLIAVIVAGFILGQHAVDRALHTPLRDALERTSGGFALDALDDRRLEAPVAIEGRLRADAALTETGVTLSIDVASIWIDGVALTTAGGIAVGVGGAVDAPSIDRWRKGTVIRAPVLLRRPARYLNAGLADQERALARRGTTLVGAVKSGALIETIAEGPWWERAASAVRARTRAALSRHVAPRSAQSHAIATAILIGDRTGLSLDVERRLQEAGTYHVIAISGGNIAILVGTLLAVFGALGLRGRLALVGTVGVICAYAFVAEGGASVARASLMAVIYLAVRLIDQRTAAANAIGLAGAAILLMSPLAVVEVGFWLTFGATAAILVCTSRILTSRLGWRRAAVSIVAGTIAAEIALMPIAALIFQRVTLAGLGLNFVALPAMTVVQLFSMLVVALDLASLATAAEWAGGVVHLGCLALTESARALDAAPWLTWRVPSPAPLAMAIYYAAVVLAVASVRAGAAQAVSTRVLKWRRASIVAIGTAAMLFIWMAAAPAARVRASGDGRLHVTMVDVGQGDAALVTFPNGRTLIVDAGGASAGGDFDIGDRVLGPTLRARGLLGVDYLAVTHGDPDHIGGAASLVRDFEPREIWWGISVANHVPTARLRAEADRRRIAWRTLQRGDRVDIGGVEVLVHHPAAPDWERQRVRNDDSLVIELRYGDVSIVLTGDIGKEVEQSLLSTLDPRPLVVLKVPHHGSATSSTAAFLEKLHPAVAIIGVGRANPYGHPVPAVLDRLHTAGARVFRTDRDGQIDVVTDGRALHVETFGGTSYTHSPLGNTKGAKRTKDTK
jgi:competence protein ComEC